jgi:dTDP-4-dehydrorhamnose 3,5-epimerase/reductase
MTLVHLSTDYVFDGTKSPHTEDEAFAPLSQYGKSKAAGDTEAAKAPKHYILRTSWVIGEGHNFVRIMMGLAEKDISPSVVDDQIGRLTFTSELVRAIDHLLTQEAPYGTYNVTNEGPSASWADITRQIFNTMGRFDLKVTKVTTEEYYKDKAGIAPRPLQSTLDLSKLHATGFKARDWREDLSAYIKKEIV